ncbi:lysophosphatidic acid receptor 6 [Nothobranchius furzeri]|uniref:Lysophosphatidic acid receptor 6-like n=1 Tax=Nothobranchius furzeri TaxID=105023 RepID=A0A8C6NTF1_NOTFU|nr:lysophosphatidic acid receptor 6-like [Nothobranchius furzeri]KAF7205909.1 lysophosphatidic acid receptor 6-like [Nothobranchius furzeri]
MERWNITDLTVKQLSPLTNCSVDTSYRFTFLQVSYSVTFLLGLATNSLALRRLCSSTCTMNSTAIYMASLSFADMFFVISLPMRIYYYHQRARAWSSNTGDESSWSPGAAYCQITFTLKYISLYGGIFFLVCIAVDRYSAVVHPLATTLRRLRVAQVVCGGIWCVVLGLSATLPLLRLAASRQNQPCLMDPTLKRHKTFILLALGLVLGSFLLPTLVLLYSYCKVLSVLRHSGQRSRGHRRNRKLTLRVIYWVLGVYLLCFLPYHLNLLGYTLTHVRLLPYCRLAKVTKAVHPVVLSLASFNCCLNPLIYYFSSSLVHREVPTCGSRGR